MVSSLSKRARAVFGREGPNGANARCGGHSISPAIKDRENNALEGKCWLKAKAQRRPCLQSLTRPSAHMAAPGSGWPAARVSAACLAWPYKAKIARPRPGRCTRHTHAFPGKSGSRAGQPARPVSKSFHPMRGPAAVLAALATILPAP